MNNLLNDARGLIDRICKAMARVEKCETMSDEVSTRQLAFVKPGTDQYLCIDDILTEEQMQDIKKYIQNTIDANKEESERFLRRVSGKAAVVNPDFEAAVQEMISQDQTEEVVTETAEQAAEEDQEEPVPEAPEEKITPELTVEAVREVYTEGDMSIRQAAEYFGVGQSKLYGFISEHGLRKPKKDNTPWRTSSHK